MIKKKITFSNILAISSIAISSYTILELKNTTSNLVVIEDLSAPKDAQILEIVDSKTLRGEITLKQLEDVDLNIRSLGVREVLSILVNKQKIDESNISDAKDDIGNDLQVNVSSISQNKDEISDLEERITALELLSQGL